MAPSPATLINGRRYSYSSIEMSIIAGTNVGVNVDIDEIDYSEELDFAFRYGTSRLPLGSTAGVWTPQECTMSMGKSKFTDFVSKLGPSWLGANMLMTVSYNDEGEPLTS